MIDDRLYAYMDSQLAHVPTDFVRYKYAEIDWNSRLIGLVGPRGVGKSTLVLQRIRQLMSEEKAGRLQMYVSADHLYFVDHRLEDFVDDFVREGGTHLYIDEVHKYQDWSRLLKQVYDVYPHLHVVFTGSSILDIKQGGADLSRRALMHQMQGLSFREYLELFHGSHNRAYTLEEIVGHKVTLEGIEHPLPLFRDYLSRGYYPFAGEAGFAQRLMQVVDQTMDVDIPHYADMKVSTARKLKRMLLVMAQLVPYKPVADSLATEIGVSKNNVPDYLTLLERAGMIGLLRNDTSGMRGLGKVEKAYIDNPTLMTVLAGGKPDLGNLRETFFYNQMRVGGGLMASVRSDFTLGGYTFEVGGRKKGGRQIEGIRNAYIVRDDIEFGHGQVVPLWQFGMNY